MKERSGRRDKREQNMKDGGWRRRGLKERNERREVRQGKDGRRKEGNR